ncbi:MAG: ATP-binding cassette domain-containing protein [Anaerolineales bacterium]|nr:energy-coupling factor ABC transporter ATP-binding protein [Anaerolineales bacterium]MCS7249247.1 energy-coupling factor ABC transporter ATP-binding protein [Anaerolineales bacterium]MDW8163061.1 ATP-binding cassette domain-containing protein [Anaerolineales bacterium]MDW8445703.1 ATP-binding cassette domain-containing protein [Anaerolineales bacterium]
MKPLITVENLDFTYPDGTPALVGINLEIGEQEFIAFIGQNGSGKTTLSKCINGLFKPTAGKVVVEGIDTSRRGVIKQLVTKVGYVFQNPDHQLFNRSVRAEIAYGPRNINLPEEEVEQRVREAARVAGVSEDLFDTHPFFLPKGLRQRVAIASILALKPRTIIVDEPTTGQDMQQSLEVMNFLRALWKEEGHTVIIITHEMRIVADYAERTVVLGQGRILLDAPTREVFAQPEILQQTYVEPPQITRLAQKISMEEPFRSVLTVEEMKQVTKEALS